MQTLGMHILLTVYPGRLGRYVYSSIAGKVVLLLSTAAVPPGPQGDTKGGEIMLEDNEVYPSPTSALPQRRKTEIPPISYTYVP